MNKKCLVLGLLLLLSTPAHSSLVRSFFQLANGVSGNYYKRHMFDNMSQVCFCGVRTGTLATETAEVSSIDMYKLTRGGFDWLKASGKKGRAFASPTKPEYGEEAANRDFTSGLVWFSPGDGVHIQYERQRTVMEAMIGNMAKVVAPGGITIKLNGGCIVNIMEYPVSLTLDYFTNILKRDETKVNAVCESAGFPHFYARAKSGNIIGVYPLDIEKMNIATLKRKYEGQIGKSTAVKDPFQIYKNISDKFNSVVCNVEVTHENKAGLNFKGIWGFLDSSTKKKFFWKKLKIDWGIASPDDPAQKMQAMNSLQGVFDEAGGVSHISSTKAILPKFYATEEVMGDPAQVFEHMLLPNDFDITFCYSMLNPKEIGASIQVEEEDFVKIWEEWFRNCPLLGMTGGFTFTKNGKPVKYPGLTTKPPALLQPQENKTVGPNYRFIPPGKITYEGENPAYTAQKKENDEIAKKEKEAIEEVVQKKVEEPSPSVDSSPEIIIEHEITMEEIKKGMPDDIKVQETPEQSSESETQDQSIPEDPVPITNPGVALCFQMLKYYQNEFGNNYAVGEKNIHFVIEVMMNFPPGANCNTWDFIVKDGVVRYKTRPLPYVLQYSLHKMTPEELEEDGQDKEKIIYVIHFKNDFFENLQEMYLHIPIDQILDNWEQFVRIIYHFNKFVQKNLGNMKNLYVLMRDTQAQVAKRIADQTSGWNFDFGPNGPSGVKMPGRSADRIEIHNFNVQNQNSYINCDLRLSNSDHIYDLIYQSWYMGDKYIMIKLQGTQLNYKIMVYKYIHDDNFKKIMDSIANIIFETYIGPDRVASLNEVKRMVDFGVIQHFSSRFQVERKPIGLEGAIYKSIELGYGDMIKSDDNVFLFNYEIKGLALPFELRGFIHTRESLPVVNLFFTSSYFRSEYIIPLTQIAEFTMHLDTMLSESVEHMFELYMEINKVERAGASADDIKKGQELGHYNFNDLLGEVISTLNGFNVYACVVVNSAPAPEELPEAKYSWQKAKEYNPNEEFIMVRSNKIFKGLPGECEPGEVNNPKVLAIYSTKIQDLPGYALTLNGISHEGHKEVKTTYHFVKNQDYAHMLSMKKMIKRFMEQIYEPKGDAGGE